jgi:hypothetical protein
MARETLVQKRATKLEKLKALQAEIDGLDQKASKHIGDLAVRAGLAEIDVSDVELLREFRAIVSRLGKGPTVASKPKAASSESPQSENP